MVFPIAFDLALAPLSGPSVPDNHQRRTMCRAWRPDGPSATVRAQITWFDLAGAR
jgi:hypothetical protein